MDERSEIHPIRAGRMAPPPMDMTSNDAPSLVCRPSPSRLSAKIVGNISE